MKKRYIFLFLFFILFLCSCTKNDGTIKNVDNKKTDNIELNKKTISNIKQAYSNHNIDCPSFYQYDDSKITNVVCYNVFGKNAILASGSNISLTKSRVEHWIFDKAFIYTENINIYLYDNVELSLVDAKDAFYNDLFSYEEVVKAYETYKKIHYKDENEHFIHEIEDVDNKNTKQIELDDFIIERIKVAIYNRCLNSNCGKDMFFKYTYEKMTYNGNPLSYNNISCYGVFGDNLLIYDSALPAEMVIDQKCWYVYNDLAFSYFKKGNLSIYNYKTNVFIDLIDYNSKKGYSYNIKNGYLDYDDFAIAYEVYYEYQSLNGLALLSIDRMLTDADNSETFYYEIDNNLKQRVLLTTIHNKVMDKNKKVIKDFILPMFYQDTMSINDIICYGKYKNCLICSYSNKKEELTSFVFGNYTISFDKETVMFVFDVESNDLYLCDSDGEDNSKICCVLDDNDLSKLYEVYLDLHNS